MKNRRINKHKHGTRVMILVAVALIMTAGLIEGCGKEETAGRIIKAIELSGGVKYTRLDKTNDVYINMNFEAEDSVATDDDSNLIMSLDSDKYVYMFENTNISMEYSGDEMDGKTYITLQSGEILNHITNPLSEASEYEIKTSNASIAIRGTKFYVKCEADRTIVACTEGKVQVTASQNDITIAANEGAIVENDQVKKADLAEIEDEIDLTVIDFTRYINGGTAGLSSGNSAAVLPEPLNEGTPNRENIEEVLTPEAVALPPLGTAYRGHFTHYIFGVNDGTLDTKNEYVSENGEAAIGGPVEIISTNSDPDYRVEIVEVMQNNRYISAVRKVNGEVEYSSRYLYDSNNLLTECQICDKFGNLVMQIKVIDYTDDGYPRNCQSTDYVYLTNGQPTGSSFVSGY